MFISILLYQAAG